MYITDIKVNDGRDPAILEFDRFDIFQGISLPKTTHFVLWQWSSYLTRFVRYQTY